MTLRPVSGNPDPLKNEDGTPKYHRSSLHPIRRTEKPEDLKEIELRPGFLAKWKELMGHPYVDYGDRECEMDTYLLARIVQHAILTQVETEPEKYLPVGPHDVTMAAMSIVQNGWAGQRRWWMYTHQVDRFLRIIWDSREELLK